MESDNEELNKNPIVTITKIDPSEIPEVTNKFLMRSEETKTSIRKNSDRNEGERNYFGWSKRHVPQSRSGRIIKGRGSFRYTPTRSRSRSITPEHWKAASRKLIKFTDFEKNEEEKKIRDEEIKRRAEERKIRHEAIAKKGDGKKSFYELSHYDDEKISILSASVTIKKQTNDPNELDYEIDEDDVRQKRMAETKNVRKNSENREKSAENIKKDRRSREYDRKTYSSSNCDHSSRRNYNENSRKSSKDCKNRKRSRSRSKNR